MKLSEIVIAPSDRRGWLSYWELRVRGFSGADVDRYQKVRNVLSPEALQRKAWRRRN